MSTKLAKTPGKPTSTTKVVKVPKTENDNLPLRSPIFCVLGHVDAGKSSLIDKLRGTQFQSSEAGGITQSISAWNMQVSDVQHYLQKFPSKKEATFQVPGLLMIDTPGHEAFMQLRTTGANLCDFAVLVLDVHKGIEKQTEESIEILKETKTPFVIALNKIDTLHKWKSNVGGCFKQNIGAQSTTANEQLNKAKKKLFLQFANLGLNVEYYFDNKDPKKCINIVPISAKTGEGLPDLLTVVLRMCEKFMKKKIQFHEDHFKGLVLKEERLKGHGDCMRILLVDGHLKIGSKFYLNGLDCTKKDTVKSLLVYNHHTKEYTPVNSVSAACACIVVPSNVTKGFRALPGSELSDTEPSEEGTNNTKLLIDSVNELINNKKMTSAISATTATSTIGELDSWGVWLVSGSIGTLHALLKLFVDAKFPVNGYSIGAVHKTDIIKIVAAMKNSRQSQLFVVINFGSEITEEAAKYAKEVGVTIESSPVVYRLLEKAQHYQKKHTELMENLYQSERQQAVFPCKLKIEPNCIFRASDPIVIGVRVLEGKLKKGTLLCTVKNNNNSSSSVQDIGVVHQMKSRNGNAVDCFESGESGSIELRNTKKKAGIHFTESDMIYSKISRQSLNLLKKHFKSQLNKSDVKLLIELKKVLRVD